jgi:hypothetical protein
MATNRSLQSTLLFVLSACILAGCELAVPFDRSKIAEEAGADDASGDATMGDATMGVEGGLDAADADAMEAASEAGPEAGHEAGEGGAACLNATTCAQPTSSDCATATCISGVCGMSFVASGTAIPKQTTGTCMKTVCDGNGGTKQIVDDTNVPVSSTVCVTESCSNGTPGKTNKAASTTCTDNGGKVCDGNGSCVACVAPSDCPASTTTCLTNTCNANVCGTSKTNKGVMCSDSGGVVCDGLGKCVATHCSDGTKDADETDIDCGGASCSPCGDAKLCLLPRDCLNKVCSGSPMGCQPASCTDNVQNGTETDVDCGGSTCAKCPDKKHCVASTDCQNGDCFGSNPGTCVSCTDGVKDGNETGTDCGGPQCDALGKLCGVGAGCVNGPDCTLGNCQSLVCAALPNSKPCTTGADCVSGNCVGQVCCDQACSGTCMACTAAHTGGMDGTCASVIAGQAPPGGGCTAAPPCGNDGTCAAGGMCEKALANTPCGAAMCSGGMMTPVAYCDGVGNCGSPTPAACPNGLGCNDAGICDMSCSSDNDCASMGSYCSNPGPDGGTCVSRGNPGATCATNDQCTSLVCGVVGQMQTNCCTAPCATGGVCGATGCDGTGTCSYPPSSTPCNTCTGSTLTTANCNGSGACGAGTSAACPNNLMCSGDNVTCLASCPSNDATGDMSCTSGFYCDGAACQTRGGTSAACTRDGQCMNGACAANMCP